MVNHIFALCFVTNTVKYWRGMDRYFVLCQIVKSLILVTKPNNNITIQQDLFLMSSNRQRQTKLMFLLNNQVWFLWQQQCLFYHPLSKRFILRTPTKCYSRSGLLPMVYYSLLSVIYVHNLWLCMSDDNLWTQTYTISKIIL